MGYVRTLISMKADLELPVVLNHELCFPIDSYYNSTKIQTFLL